MWFFLDYSNLCYVFLYSFSGAENEPRDIHPLQGLTSSSSVATRDSLSELSSPLAAPSVPPIWGGCNRSSCRSHFGILDPSKGRDELFMLPHYTLKGVLAKSLIIYTIENTEGFRGLAAPELVG